MASAGTRPINRDRSSRADESDVEPRRTGMVRHKGGGDWPRNESKGDVGALGRVSGVPTAPNLAVFPRTQECGPCPMRVRDGRARSQTTRSMLIREIQVQTDLDASQRRWHR